jgi:hypothetical protein
MAEFDTIRPHVINLSEGFLSAGGAYQTSLADVEKIFQEHLPAYVATTDKPRIVVYAHGGLVDEKAGLALAQLHVPWWLKNGVFPLYFVWETGPVETFLAVHRPRTRPTFGFSDTLEGISEAVDELKDFAFETFTRTVNGEQYWSQMKTWAAASVRQGGGATEVARRLVKFVTAETEKKVELHAIGHSAGAIFHSHFLPFCLSQPDASKLSVKTLQFLAPAIRVDSFQERLMPLLSRGIDDLTVYTMNDDAERNDVCGAGNFTPYHKSLLYLIYRALELEDNTPILGLEKSLRDTVNVPDEVRAALGIGTDKERVRWSPTEGVTESLSHGGFDDDPATMNSAAKKILGKKPTIDFADALKPHAAALEAMESPASTTRRRRTFSATTSELEAALPLPTVADPRELSRQNLIQAMQEFIQAYENPEN